MKWLSCWFLCGHQELHLCTRRVLCLRRPGWRRYIIIVVFISPCKPLCLWGKVDCVLLLFNTWLKKRNLRCITCCRLWLLLPSFVYLLRFHPLLTALRVWPRLHFTSACFWMFQAAFSKHTHPKYQRKAGYLFHIFFFDMLFSMFFLPKECGPIS